MNDKNNIAKRIDLSALPRKKDNKINWVKSTGYKVPFVYGDISGDILLIEYIIKKRVFKVFIEGYTKFQYDTASIDTIKNCNIGRLLHKKIVDTNPEMVQYFVDKSDALKYSCQSNVRTNVKCPFCGFEKHQIISNLYQFGFSCPQCSDGVSYPNKLMFNILKQLDVDFKNEITKRTFGFKWVEKYRYDFYFEVGENRYFIEMDGHFHKINRMGTVNDIILADNKKDTLALEHGIKIIRIDCCYDNEKNKLSFIQNSIINSDLSNIFDLSNIDWDIANKSAISSNIILAAKYWDDGCFVNQIARRIGVSTDSVTNYLKIAQTLNLCNYNKENSEYRRIQSIIESKRKSSFYI